MGSGGSVSITNLKLISKFNGFTSPIVHNNVYISRVLIILCTILDPRALLFYSTRWRGKTWALGSKMFMHINAVHAQCCNFKTYF